MGWLAGVKSSDGLVDKFGKRFLLSLYTGQCHFFSISHRLSVVGLPPRCPQAVWCH